MKYLGAAYLVYLGLRRLLDRAVTIAPPAGSEGRLRRAFLDGVVVNVLNPKTALFFLAFLPQFVDVPRGRIAAQVLGLGCLFVMLGLVTDGLYAIGAGSAASWLRPYAGSVTRQRWVSGGMYIGLGVAAALSSGNRK